MNTKYIHYEFTHNQQSPEEIVEIIMRTLNPSSVVDIGCGTGNFLYQFKKAGVQKILGIDGSWVDRNVLLKNLDKDEFYEMNLEEPIRVNQKFDIALCTEVAEHIDEKYADNFIESLVGLSDIIIFSAAIPYQGGQNHVNEQWVEYWKVKFNRHNYIVYDVLRPLLWNNKRIQWWYKQNMFVVCNKQISLDISKFAIDTNNIVNDYIHPEPYIFKSKRLDDMVAGKMEFGFYLKLIIKKIRSAIFSN